MRSIEIAFIRLGILLLSILPVVGFSQSPCEKWGLSLGGIYDDMGYDIQTKGDYIYICGSYSDTLQINRDHYLVSKGGTDVFIAKYLKNGSLVWVESAGGVWDDRAQEICIDSNDEIVIVGDFTGNAVFGKHILVSNGDYDMFTAKLSNQGDFLWAVGYGGLLIDNGRAVTVDSENSIFTLGYFYDEVQFGMNILTSYGSNDIVLTKHDSDGNFLWVSHFGGYADDDPRSVTVDVNGSLLICGYFKEYLNMHGSSQPLFGLGDKDAFWIRLDTSGNAITGKAFGSSSIDVAERIKTDLQGNIYVGGIYSAAFDFAGQTVPSFGQYDSFVCKFDINGNEKWLQIGSGYGNDFTIGLDVSKAGDVITTGYFSDQAHFSDTVVNSKGQRDIFVAQYSSMGDLEDLSIYGGEGNDSGWGICFSDYNWFFTGSFELFLNIGNGILVSNGLSDIIVGCSGNIEHDFEFEWFASGLNVNFSLLGALPDSVLWSFGDGQTSYELNPFHSYSVPGEYEVSVMGYFACNVDTAFHIVKLCELPVPSFSFTTEERTVYYDNSLTIADSVLWSFGDGTISNQSNPVHCFDVPGYYITCLTAFNPCGVDSLCIPVKLCDSSQAAFTYSAQGNLVTFYNQSINFTSLLWDFGDGSTSELENPLHTYEEDGSFFVKLYCINQCDTVLALDTITTCMQPVALFDYNYLGDLTYEFINESISYTSTELYWSFGDGNYSTENHPIHKYNDWELYTVKLTVYNQCGYDTSSCFINLPTDVFKGTDDRMIVFQRERGGEITVLFEDKSEFGQYVVLNDISGNILFKGVKENIMLIPATGLKSGLFILTSYNKEGKKQSSRKIFVK